MENNKNTDRTKKIVKFHGRQYIAMKEFTEKSCEGCALVNKGCYKDEKVLKICRKGCVFLPISQIDYINPLDY